MSNPIKITPDDELMAFLDAQVASGKFESPEAAALDGLRRVKAHEDWVKDARQKIQEGIDQANRGELIDGEEFMAELGAELLAHAEREEREKRSA